MHMLLLKNTDDILPTEELKYMEVFTDVHWSLYETDWLPSVYDVRKVLQNVVVQENILGVVQCSPQLNTWLACNINVPYMQVWHTLNVADLYPDHDHRGQHLKHGDLAAHMDFCHWLAEQP
jgi:hypothetical protein